MTRDWIKQSTFSYELNKGKQYRSDRITSTDEYILEAKRKAYPGPDAYAPKRQKKIAGVPFSDQKDDQLQMAANAEWYAKATPGAKYRPSTVSTTSTD